MGILTQYDIDVDKLKQLEGPWDIGYAISLHIISSTAKDPDHHIYDTKRTPLGELLFRFKYRSVYQNKDILAEIASTIIRNIFKDSPIDLITIPPPNINTRDYQPTEEIVRCISLKLGIPFSQLFQQKGHGKTMKNIEWKEDKKKYLRNNLFINPGDIKKKNILLIDDIFDSGATLEVCTELLKNQGCGCIYVLTLTRTRG